MSLSPEPHEMHQTNKQDIPNLSEITQQPGIQVSHSPVVHGLREQFHVRFLELLKS